MKRLYSFFVFCITIMSMNAQAPGGISSGLKVWLKADAGTSSTTNNAYLSSWNDQSGNGYNATQGVVAAKPQYLTNMMNGNPVVKTSSTQYFNIDLSSINNTNHTIFTVTLRQSSGSFQEIIGVNEPGAYVGLSLGYAGSTLIRYFQYGNITPLPCPAYAGSSEIPTILACQFDVAAGKKVWNTRDGVYSSWTGNNKTQFPFTAMGRVGRGNGNYGLTGQIAEVIVYNRVLTDAEKKKVHSYLSIKYGLPNPLTEQEYYNEPSYANDIFGIGKNVTTQGLNQATSTSLALDDILELRSPSSLNDGDYLICGNNNGSLTFGAYGGTSCAITSALGRKWKFKRVVDPGTVTVRFDLTGITGFTSSELALVVDANGNGFDDDTPLTGTYTAPYFDVAGVNIPDGAIIGLVTSKPVWYAIASGNADAAIWSSSPTGTPQLLSSFCANSDLVVNAGVTVTNNWATLNCKNFTVSLGGIWNASSNTLNATGNVTISGTFNAQTSTLQLTGTQAQTIGGNGFANVYNFTLNNAAGAVISASGGGVLARNLITITSGTLTTNAKLTLVSDGSSTGMIGPLTTGSISGNVTVQRYHNATAQGWVNLACSVQGKTIQDWNDDLITTGFSGADYPPPYSFNNIQYYTEATAGGINTGYVGVTNVTNSIVAGRGYFAFMNAGVMNLDVDGQIYSGNFTMPVSFTNTGNPGGDGWNLVGNPYPCTIDWNSAAWTKTNLNNAVYVWNAALGQYASYVAGVGTNGGSRYIPSSQSFFVMANASGAALTLTENCKTSNQGTFKSTSIPGQAFTLHVENDFYSDETTLFRNVNGTNNFDSDLDAYKLKSPLTEVPYLATIGQEGNDLSINTFNIGTDELIIPVRIEAGVTGIYMLTHQGLSSFANGACIVLEDLLYNVSYPLNNEESIALDLEAGNHELRFQLRIGGSHIANTTSSGCPGIENGTAQVTIDNGHNANVIWMDENGNVIAHSENVSGADEIINLAPGLYSVQIENNGQCHTTSADFFIQADEPIAASAAVSPASCQNEDDASVMLHLIGGTSPYSVTWSNGETTEMLNNIESGEYTAFVTDVKGCNTSFSFNVPVSSSLTSSFETTFDTYELMNGSVSVDFYNTSENAENFHWNFGNSGYTSEDSNPSHLFSSKGVYEITLTTEDEDCVVLSKKSIRITNPKSEANEFASEMIGALTDNGVQIMFYFDQPRNLRIQAYNVLGQQLIEPINGTYERQTILFSDRRYAANALIEVIDLNTGERALMRMGI